MDLREQVNTFIREISTSNLHGFFRLANGNYKPQEESFDHYLDENLPISDLSQIGQIDFADERQIGLFLGNLTQEITTRSGKKRQYDLAVKILKKELIDAGIFIFIDAVGKFRFSLVVSQFIGKKRTFTNYRRYTYYVDPDTYNRTFIDQLGQADFSDIEGVLDAFSVEKVTKEFFQKYNELFHKAEEGITLNWDNEHKRLFTQRFFNRVLFLIFLEKKGWLIFSHNPDYLRALYDDYSEKKQSDRNFHNDRLNILFFNGLNNPKDTHGEDKEEIVQLIGNVPYLNGGLFEEYEDDYDWCFPDEIISDLLDEIIYRFNFTVAESTPMDIEVAVDPEMLGKIFEELVTGRHETGSYYTPKRIVSYMCRESIKYFLISNLKEETDIAIKEFVDNNNPVALQNPKEVLRTLKSIKACDPACGSGAYLLGLLHEIIDLSMLLIEEKELDAFSFYGMKLDIIKNNLYGVDVDSFAVNIAQLRLWLSLVVDYEGDDPPPLPNLEFKVEVGDSLLAQVPAAGLQPDMFMYGKIQEFLRLKNDFMTTHNGSEKKRQLAVKIEDIRKEIAEWAHEGGTEGFEWLVEFAEVFSPHLAEGTFGGKLTGVINVVPGQMELVEKERISGFDIILTNPPYIRQEIINGEFGDGYKRKLIKLFPEDYVNTADLYVAFFARAHQLLKPSGICCFISSNKWLRADYGKKIRKHLLDKEAFHLVVDFGELPVFKTASTFPAIFLWEKEKRDQKPTKWAPVKNLDDCYNEGVRQHVDRISESLPSTQFGNGKPRLVQRTIAKTLLIMESAGARLGEYVSFEIYYGIKTGLNEAFIIDGITRSEIISKDKSSAEIIKPVLRGDNIRQYEIQYRDQYLIWTYIGVPIKRYPGVFSYLNKYQDQAKKRSDQGKHWWELRSCDYYDSFNKPKIIWADISKKPRFYLDQDGYFVSNTGYILPKEDWFLLAILNSNAAWNYLSSTSAILGDEQKGGRVRFIYQYMINLPIPDSSKKNKETIIALAKNLQKLHKARRQKVEQFLSDIGSSPYISSSQSPLEKPWLLSERKFNNSAKKFKSPDKRVFKRAKEETSIITAKIEDLEENINNIVDDLYGIG